MIDNNMTDPHVQTLVAQAASAAAPHGIEVYIEDIPPYPGSQPGRKRLHIGYRAENYWSPMYHLGNLSDEDLTDLINYFTNHPVNLEDSMNIYSTDLFKYMAGDMIGQATVTLTIAGVTMERMNSGKGGEQVKPCLRFVERDKLMVLNKTNASTIAKELGSETDRWINGRVTVAAPMIDAFGKTTRTLRVIKVEAPEVAVKSRGNGNGNTPAPAQAVLNAAAEAERAIAAGVSQRWPHSAPPDDPATIRQYGDGSHVGAAAVAHYDAYVAAHGDAPADADDLRQWVNEQQQPA